MQNIRLDEAQARIKITQWNINNLRYAYDTTVMPESEELKSLLMKFKGESEKAGLKFNIQKTKVMASGHTTSWQIDREKWKQWWTLFSWTPKITADGDCRLQIKRQLLIGRKAMANLGCVLKSRDITLPTNVCLVRAMVFPVVMYGYKKTEHWRIDAFELWH